MKRAIWIESDQVGTSPRIALWALGFRPFYLAGALFGSIAMLLWLGALAGWPLLTPRPTCRERYGTSTK